MKIAKHKVGRKSVPFDFVLEALDSLSPYTKPMFGCTAIYVDLKIIFILRDKAGSYPKDNGVWIATTPEHHASLMAEFPSMRSIGLFGSDGPTSWQILPADASDFEEAVLRACDLVLAGDPRIGKLPGAKKKAGPAKKSPVKKAKSKRSPKRS